MNGSSVVGIVSLFFALTACGGGSSSSAPATPPNAAPISDAGTAQSVLLGATVTLDGSASKDANGDTLTYSWTLSSKPAGSNVVLNSSTSTRPSLTPDLGGTYIASLVVSDGKASSNTSNVVITVTPPTEPGYVFNAGDSVATSVGTNTRLGIPTWNLYNGDKLTFSWTLTSKPLGSNAALVASNTNHPRLTPDAPGAYVVSMVVSDGKRLSVPSKMTVTALEVPVYAGFVNLINNSPCNDLVSDLFLVDGKYVFAFSEGSCADARYSAGLYGLNSAQLLCGVRDSIAGPRRNCPDLSTSALFDGLFPYRFVSNLDMSNSTDNAHTVSKFVKAAPLPAGAVAVGFTSIDNITPWAGAIPNQGFSIARSDAEWKALWANYQGNPNPATQVQVDFAKQILFGYSYVQVGSCNTTRVSSVYILQNKVVVEAVTRPNSGPNMLCTFAIGTQAEYVSIDLPATTNMEFEIKRKEATY